MRCVFLCLLLQTSALAILRQEDQQPEQITPPLTTVADPSISVEQLQTQLKDLPATTEADGSPSRDARLISQAIEDLKAAEGQRAKLAKLKSDATAAPAQLKRLRATLEEPQAAATNTPEGTDLVTAQQELAGLEQQLAELDKRVAEIESERERRITRRADVPQRLSQVRTEIEQLGKTADETQDANTVSSRTARLSRLRSEAIVLEQEIPAYNATDPVLTAERDVLARRVARLRKQVDAWRRFVTERRMSEAERHAREATAWAEEVSNPVRPLAVEIAALAEKLVDDRKAIAIRISEVQDISSLVKIDRDRLQTEFSELTARAEAAGFTNSVGLLLRKQRRNLPGVSDLQGRIEERQEEIGQTHVKRIEYQHDRPSADALEVEIERQVELFANRSPDIQRSQLADEVRTTLTARSTYLDGVVNDLNSLLDRLAELDSEEQQLLRQTETQSAYISEHILWVRGTTAVSTATLYASWTAWEWTTRRIVNAFAKLSDDLKRSSALWLAFLMLVVLLLAARIQLSKSLPALAETAKRRSTTSMGPTYRAFGITLLLSVLGPLVLQFAAWRLSKATLESPAESAVSAALTSTAGLWFLFDCVRRMCRPNGVARAHFDWPDKSIGSLRAMARTALMFCVPLAFLVVITEQSGSDLYHTSLGRLALVAALLGFAWRQYRILRPGGRIMTELAARFPDSWLTRLRYIYPMTALVPATLAGLALSGYLFAARQLAIRFVESLWLTVIVMLCIAVLRRWQLLTYRALAMNQARERRAAALKEAEDNGTVIEATNAALDEEAIVLTSSNEQTSKLILWTFGAIGLSGLAVLWSDVLPALSSFYGIKLWKNGLVDGTATEIEQWIKVSDIGAAVGIFVVTIAAARNIPGLLKFAVLQRLPLDSGSRYAISSVFRYVIIVAGFIIAFRFLGIGWSNVQWLVAAMSVGLGFGLQEVFANFVSGLILLFERPIRVGDTVTVGDITGTVTRIRIRATTIVDWDRKELIVPNREFVTGQLVNWTLTDPTLRVIIQVGVAYGSDTRLATELLYRVASEQADILAEPTPTVVFQSFGDSTLDFELRFFVSSPTRYRTIRHDVNLSIDDLFREHNIEIAFPQRDFRFRSADVPFVVQQATLASDSHEAPANMGS